MLPFRLDGADAVDLDPGPLLLEASAGTGKTYTIAGLVTRLVLEHGLGLERIAVMTFTSAATAELRDRIRARLAAVAEALAGGDADPFAGWLRERHRALPAAARGEWDRRLRRALAAIDAAPIATIHAFARRVAVEHAALVGIDPAAPVTVELDTWRDQVVRDWFRVHLRDADPRVVALLAADPLSALAEAARSGEQHPLAAIATAPCTAAELALRCDRAAAWWAGHRARLVEQTERHLGRLAKNSIFHPGNLTKRLDELDRRFACQPATTKIKVEDWWDDEKLTKLDAFPAFDRTLFTAIPAHLPEPAAWRAGLLAAFAGHYREALARRRSAARDLHVGDALLALDAALHGADGERLAARIGARYDAVLIDEFQDTDLLQWRIMERCFARAPHRLVLIGDPKQAIYAFRGADVYAYAAARERIPATRRFTLDCNHRSDRGLVEALNTLYLGDRALPPLAEPFAVRGVDFHAVRAAREQRLDPGSLDPAPLQILALDPGLAANADAALGASEVVVVAEIARLLDPATGAVITRDGAGVPIAPGDIAVLVRSHRQADRLHARLAAAGIPAVRQDRSSVFAGEAAAELQALLAGCVDPRRDRRLRAAAATRLVGAPAAELVAEPPGAALAALPLRLAALGEVLERRGVAAWWYQACDTDLGWGAPRQRLAALGDGGRLAMDVLHLVELMAAETALAPEALPGWLAQQRGDDDAGEARQRRLERDDAAVRVLTVHVSKGLQYPVVFEAFAWNGCRTPEPPLLVHPGDGAEAERHLGPPGAATLRQAEREALGDALRKLYVGLTRAMHRLYVVWAPQPPARQGGAGSTTSALAWLLCGRDQTGGLDRGAYAAVQARWSAGLVLPAHPGIAVQAIATLPAAVRVAPPAAPAPDPLRAVLAPGWIERRWTRCSFTGLSRRAEAAEAADAAEHDHDQATAHQPRDDDEAPGGAALGTLVHTLFQHADLARWRDQPETVVQALVQQAARDGVALTEAQAARLAAAMRRAVVQPAPGLGAALAELPGTALAREWPVRLALRQASPALATVFAGRTPQAPQWPATLARVQLPAGVFTGVLDALVCVDGRFHVVDWKTNLLDAYDPASLAAAMASEHYLLQAHLYLLAVHRFLRWRLADYDPARHLGVAAYVFLRGTRDDDPAAGWAVVEPDPAILEALDACC